MLGRWSSHIILGAVPSVVELLCVAAANAVVVVAQAQSQLGPEHETRYVEGRGKARRRVLSLVCMPPCSPRAFRFVILCCFLM